MFLYKDLGIRSIEEEDLLFLKDQRNDPDTWKYLTDITMLNNQSQQDWLRRLMPNQRKKCFILFKKATQESIGFIRMDEIDYINRSIQIGADIHSDHRGKGYATTTYELLLKYCFDYLNMNRIWLMVLDYNTRAKHVYEKVGFKEEGRMREAIYRENKYHDYIIMGILRSEYY